MSRPLTASPRRESFRHLLHCAFLDTLCVCMGYLSMGFAFGILLVTSVSGSNAGTAALMSCTTVSGSMQFAAVDMLRNPRQYSLLLTALLAVFINVRYALYGIPFLRLFKGYPRYVRYFLIFGLTDETYAIESSCRRKGRTRMHYFLLVTFLDYAYWICGSVLGALAGARWPWSTEGMDFAMAALFLVVLTDLCREKCNRPGAAVGTVITLAVLAVFLLFFPAHVNKMLAVVVPLMLLTLLVLKRKLAPERSSE